MLLLQGVTASKPPLLHMLSLCFVLENDKLDFSFLLEAANSVKAAETFPSSLDSGIHFCSFHLHLAL